MRQGESRREGRGGKEKRRERETDRQTDRETERQKECDILVQNVSMALFGLTLEVTQHYPFQHIPFIGIVTVSHSDSRGGKIDSTTR